MPGIIDLPKFNHEDLKEIVASGRGLVTEAIVFIVYSIQVFSSHDDKV